MVKCSSTYTSLLNELHLGTKSNQGKTAHKMFSLPAAAVVVVATSSLTSISDFDLHAIPLGAWAPEKQRAF